MENKDLLIESFSDLALDFSELEYLLASNLSKVNKFIKELRSSQKFLEKRTYQSVRQNTDRLLNQYNKYLREIIILLKYASGGKYSLELLKRLVEKKDSYFDLVRTNQGILGSLITATDWQSPSFSHSLNSQAGRQTGKITGTINDYKRDSHIDEQAYEKLYLKEYIDSRFKFKINVFMTNSGQSAFTTIFNFLIMDGKIKRKVLIGKSVYFQYKQLVMKSLGKQVIEIDELKINKILQTIKKVKPSVIFLDSLANSKNIAVPDLTKIINYLIRNFVEEVYLVIDNTCLTTTFQPMEMVVGKTNKIHLILFESLMKFLQFGIDRVTGGIIVAYGKDTKKIFEYRKHLGTNISDSSVYAVPEPNREILERRLARYHRNSCLLATYLNYYKNSKNTPVQTIIYPGLPNHPSYPWSKTMPFWGCFFNIGFKKEYENTVRYKKFIQLAINEAKKRKVDLVGGTSFGLNKTRVYLTSLWTDYGQPFIRVAVGTENRLQIEELKKVFKASLTKFQSPLSSFMLTSINKMQKKVGLNRV